MIVVSMQGNHNSGVFAGHSLSVLSLQDPMYNSGVFAGHTITVVSLQDTLYNRVKSHRGES